MYEELPNGEANQRLASGEWMAVLTSALGRKTVKRRGSLG
jgi:hypothetical protein